MPNTSSPARAASSNTVSSVCWDGWLDVGMLSTMS